MPSTENGRANSFSLRRFRFFESSGSRFLETRVLNSWSLQTTQRSSASSRTVTSLHTDGIHNQQNCDWCWHLSQSPRTWSGSPTPSSHLKWESNTIIQHHHPTPSSKQVVTSVLFYYTICWRGSLTDKVTKQLKNLVKKAGRMLDAQRTLVERGTWSKVQVILDNVGNPSTTSQQAGKLVAEDDPPLLSFSAQYALKTYVTDSIVVIWILYKTEMDMNPHCGHKWVNHTSLWGIVCEIYFSIMLLRVRGNTWLVSCMQTGGYYVMLYHQSIPLPPGTWLLVGH